MCYLSSYSGWRAGELGGDAQLRKRYELASFLTIMLPRDFWHNINTRQTVVIINEGSAGSPLFADCFIPSFYFFHPSL